MDGNVLEANDNFLILMAYTLREIFGQHHRVFLDKETAAHTAYARFWCDLREGKSSRRSSDASPRTGRRSGSRRPITRLRPERQALQDRQDRHRHHRRRFARADLSRAQKEVQHDPATGLPNRLGLRKFMRQALSATDSELALFYLDLDHFKPINDTFGHDIGDLVLRTVAPV
ncbi:GGDEF domain-containing protein [Burkholderia sp. PAMC 26561]|uniref:GGDEF domain-containing protein n=1 Tax=Burkholderia sp. PAMC 26561 TaxID=1795043 RepID=UPI00076AFAA5|nr:GGDEF domain-containing protein [Burkholderia sp. PAMC 26561]AME28254.1 hypothetical protein AXG89_30960 [Burkholderia sp. PAMC 26561]